MQQRYTSAETSINQVPAIFRLINMLWRDADSYWRDASYVLDYGGGRYDTFTERLALLGAKNLVYDPFNRSEEHNARVRDTLAHNPADVGLCSNVLNVVKESGIRQQILRDMKTMISKESVCYFTVYEGSRTSNGRTTKKGWQANRPTASYLRDIRKEFGTVWQPYSKLIVAMEPK